MESTMEYVTTTSGAKKIALHGINHWLYWSGTTPNQCPYQIERYAKSAMLKMEPLEIGNDDKKTFPIKTFAVRTPPRKS